MLEKSAKKRISPSPDSVDPKAMAGKSGIKAPRGGETSMIGLYPVTEQSLDQCFSEHELEAYLATISR